MVFRGLCRLVEVAMIRKKDFDWSCHEWSCLVKGEIKSADIHQLERNFILLELLQKRWACTAVWDGIGNKRKLELSRACGESCEISANHVRFLRWIAVGRQVFNYLNIVM